MEFVSGKAVIRDRKTDGMTLRGEEFMKAMRQALFSKTRDTRGPFRYIFARPQEFSFNEQQFLYSEIAKVRHDWRQMKIIWEAKDYEEQPLTDIVEATWPFVISNERNIVLRRFGEIADFLETFRAIFGRLCVIGGGLVFADIGYTVDRRPAVDIADAMERVSLVGLRKMRRLNPVMREDYERYHRLLEEQRATEASTDFRNEEEDRGLNVDEGSLLRSGLAGADSEYGEWEVEGFVEGQEHSIRSTERILEVIEYVPPSVRDDLKRFANLMAEIISRIRGRS